MFPWWFTLNPAPKMYTVCPDTHFLSSTPPQAAHKFRGASDLPVSPRPRHGVTVKKLNLQNWHDLKTDKSKILKQPMSLLFLLWSAQRNKLNRANCKALLYWVRLVFSYCLHFKLHLNAGLSKKRKKDDDNGKRENKSTDQVLFVSHRVINLQLLFNLKHACLVKLSAGPECVRTAFYLLKETFHFTAHDTYGSWWPPCERASVCVFQCGIHIHV